jgi:hypothetical protein
MIYYTELVYALNLEDNSLISNIGRMLFLALFALGLDHLGPEGRPGIYPLGPLEISLVPEMIIAAQSFKNSAYFHYLTHGYVI